MEEQVLSPAGAITERLKVPEGVKIPATIEETVGVCRNIFDTSTSSKKNKVDNIWAHLKTAPKKKSSDSFEVTNLVPSDYADLAKWLEHVYEKQYRLGQGFTIANPLVEAIFQQLQIALDKEKCRVRVNHFGLYAPSYVDALGTAGYSYREPHVYQNEVTGSHERVVDNRYLGRGHFAEKRSFHAVLLGCSSLSSADDFKKIVASMNPKAETLIIDKDPVAIALSENVGVKALQDDVLSVEAESLQVDFLATNFLISSMPTEQRIDAYRQLFLTWRERIYPRTGRLVMVEQLDKSEAKKVIKLANECGYQVTGDHNSRTGWGKNRKAIRYTSNDNIDPALSRLNSVLDSDRTYSGDYYSSQVKTDVVEEARTLIFVPEGEDGPYVNEYFD